jgi:hypothetical protein
MADRTTSVSKHIEGLHEDENVLDRETPLKDKFSKAPEQNREKEPRPKGPERDGSRMVREDAPGLQPTPSGRMRRVPDRFAANRKLEQDRKEAAAQNEASVKGWEKFQERQREGVNREQDNERGNTPLYGNPQEREPDSREAEKDKSQKETPEQAWERFQKRQQEIDHEQDRGREDERER